MMSLLRAIFIWWRGATPGHRATRSTSRWRVGRGISQRSLAPGELVIKRLVGDSRISGRSCIVEEAMPAAATPRE